jgi:site-specific DNA recombinase
LSARLARIKRETDQAVDAILENPTSRSLQERLAELEKKRDEAEAAMTDVEPPPVVEFHPNVAESYRKKVRDLRAALAQCGEDDRADAMAAIRELVEKVEIIPAGPYGPVELRIHGRLATLLHASKNGAIKPPESMGAMVAGARNHREFPICVAL